MATASGVTVQDDVVSKFNEIKLGKKYTYIQMKISDDHKQIEIDKVESGGTLIEFVAQLPRDDCRWAVFDFHYDLAESGERKQLVFIAWCPDSAKIKQKMLYASSKDTLKRKLVGIMHEVQATELDELSYQTIYEKVTRK